VITSLVGDSFYPTNVSRTKSELAISPYRFSDLERMDSVAKRR